MWVGVRLQTSTSPTSPLSGLSSPMASTIRTLVVDDEPTAREVLARYVDRHAALKRAGACSDAVEAANALRDGDIDLLLLDVEMPEMSGLELIKSTDASPAVVLVTSSEDYAVEAFELAAVDYLVKPVRYARFLEAINRVESQRMESGSAASPSPNASTQDTDGGKGENTLFLREDGDLVRVNLTDVQFIEAKGDYMLVQTSSEQHMIHSTLKKIEEQLPSDAFMRVHRSYLARIDQIEKIEEDRLSVGGRQVPIGPTYREALLERVESL